MHESKPPPFPPPPKKRGWSRTPMVHTIFYLLICYVVSMFLLAEDATTSSPFTTADYQLDDATEGDIRLVGGSTDREGRVEIYRNGEWGTVCENNWSNYEARVVCRKLGFPSDDAEALSTAHFGQGSGPIHLHHIYCYGGESNLESCTTYEWNYPNNCGHSEDVGVRCGKLIL